MANVYCTEAHCSRCQVRKWAARCRLSNSFSAFLQDWRIHVCDFAYLLSLSAAKSMCVFVYAPFKTKTKNLCSVSHYFAGHICGSISSHWILYQCMLTCKVGPVSKPPLCVINTISQHNASAFIIASKASVKYRRPIGTRTNDLLDFVNLGYSILKNCASSCSGFCSTE